MKYTKMIYGNEFINIDSLYTDNKLLQVPVVIATLPVALLGILAIVGMTPMTLTIDEIRNLRCHRLRRHRKGEKYFYEKIW